MFWSKPRQLAQGVIGDIRESGELKPQTLREHLDRGARLLVPIDRGVSPWPGPKHFEISHKQAMTLVDAIEDAKVRVTFVLRSDGTIALIRRENAEPSDDAVHDREPEQVPGLQPDNDR
jgi:hypothetical protein